MNKTELQEKLKSLNIVFDEAMTKDELKGLLPKEPVVTDASPDEVEDPNVKVEEPAPEVVAPLEESPVADPVVVPEPLKESAAPVETPKVENPDAEYESWLNKHPEHVPGPAEHIKWREGFRP